MPNKYQDLLNSLNQVHIVEAYNKGTPEQRSSLEKQLDHLDEIYPGGLKAYHQRSLILLKDSANSANPYKDYHIGIPNGVVLNTDAPQKIEHYETIGLKQFNHTAFVLVAGGLGERLGYPGIKIAIPIELLTKKRFIHYYIEYILTYQKKFCSEGVKIPLAIMTSGDTHDQTVEILQKNDYFGMHKDQITIVKQEKIPAMTDNQARFAFNQETFQIDTKPHGHGDIHTLLYQHKLIEQWHNDDKKWVVFFQDTNPFSFRAFPMTLGVSAEKDYDFNSISAPRKVGEAVGAITTLVHQQTGKNLTINVEYNLLEGLFKESGGQKTDQSGNSIFPGNINSFAIKISTYNKVLNETKGQISEFINPKYADETKTKFKSSARLECLMQDYPKLLPNCDKVGFTDIPKGFCFTAVKNDLKTAVEKVNKGISGESASTCESDFNFFNRKMLRMCGAQIEQDEPRQAGEIKLPLFPMVSISPQFATCYTEMKKKVNKLKMTAKSSLILSSDCILDDVYIDGHEEVTEQGKVSLNVTDKSYKNLVALKGDEEPYLKIRGYDLE